MSRTICKHHKPVVSCTHGKPPHPQGHPGQGRSCPSPFSITQAPQADSASGRQGALASAQASMKHRTRYPHYPQCAWCQKPNDTPRSVLCYDCHSKASWWQALAYIQVARAIKRGELRPPYRLRCVDCGRRAQCYDHRLYAAPLQVEPVCLSCNTRRGSALDFLRPQYPA